MTTYLMYLLGSIVLGIGFGVNAWVQWKLGTQKAKDEAGQTWKELAEAKDEKVKQLEERVAVLEVKYRALESEKNGLETKVAVLEKVRPSELFEETVTKLLDEMKQSREDFLQHASQDAEAFTNMWERIDRTNDIAIQNHNMLKKLCKEG